MITLAQKIKKNNLSPYQKIANDNNTSYLYVYQIACGTRKAMRGKGLKIKNELEKLAKNENI